jgi:hypothetical protein
MPKVTVYQFRTYDDAKDRVILSACKMTAEGIASIGGQIIADTEEQVGETALDEEGRYYPNA